MDDGTAPDREIVLDHLRWLDDAPRSRTDRARARAPIAALQVVALGDPDPWLRARCLAVLDHVANEVSTATFALALRDPVPAVRAQAVHGLACERCRTTDVCVDDVVARVVAAFDAERDAAVRHRMLEVLVRYADRDARAARRLADAAERDPDELVRIAAAGARTSGHVVGRSRLARRRRRPRP